MQQLCNQLLPSGGVSLFADLVANRSGASADGSAQTYTITGAVAWAGNYVVIEDGTTTNDFDVADTLSRLVPEQLHQANAAVLLT